MHTATVIPHFSGIPSFFRACCKDATLGGNLGYEHAGRELCRHLYELVPFELESDDWNEEVERLRPIVESANREEVLRWFIERFPKCIAIVPTRRRDSFLRGVFVSLRELFDIDGVEE